MYFLFYPLSDEDSDVGNPMIAADEDLSSPDELDYAPQSATKVTRTVDQSESDEEEEEEEEATPAILTPIKAPAPIRRPTKPKASPKPLKSALDVELTESEEEEEEGSEEGFPATTKKRGHLSASKPQSNGKGEKLEDIFEPPRITGKKKDENKGLMLQFAVSAKPPPPASSKGSKVSKDVDTPTEESPDQKRKEKKKKKSKRRKEEDGGGQGAGGEGGGENETAAGRNGRTGSLTGSSNPYSAIASLDAWLNSDDTGGLVRVRVQLYA